VESTAGHIGVSKGVSAKRSRSERAASNAAASLTLAVVSCGFVYVRTVPVCVSVTVIVY
jgi:hypothetical protein